MDELITWQGETLAHIIRADVSPTGTIFVTPKEYSIQVGFVVAASESRIQPHIHRPLERRVVGTPELLLVREGVCEVDIYNDDRALVRTVRLGRGDIVLLVGGGHGFRMIEDTVLLEAKQGPYFGLEDKTRFHADSESPDDSGK